MKQMLYQLHITLPTLPPKLKDPNAPEGAFPNDSLNPEGNWTNTSRYTITRSGWGLWNNYADKSSGFFPGADSARLGNYAPIDLLKMKDGKKITTVDEWWNKRRLEILEDLKNELYGRIPDAGILPKVNFKVVTTKGGKGNSAYIQKEITGEIDISRYPEVRNRPVVSATLRVPATATGPVPVMVVFGGFGNTVDRYWELAKPNGWGVCSFNPNALQPDSGDGLTSYLIGLVNKGNWRKPDDWGSLVAWSWGISRLIDYFETDKDVDAKAIGLTGHSRYGKATLVAMAYEPRIAIGFPSDGGSLGPKMNRRHWGQDLENSAGESEYHWMAGNFFKFCGELIPGQYLPRKIENCPVDAHSLLALVAPRPVLLNGGNQSSWCDPYGMYLTAVNASPVYELLGKKGIVMPDEKPKLEMGYIDGTVAYRYHNGGHTDQPEWPDFYRFAAQFIKVPILSVSTDVIIMGNNGGSDTVTIKANSDWKISNTAPWVTVDQKSAMEGEYVVITVKPNTESKARSAVLAVESEGYKKAITINQASANPSQKVSISELEISGKENSIAEFELTSNTAWTIVCSDNWLNILDENGVNDKSIKIQATANPRVEKRTSTITVTADSLEPQKISITQTEGDPSLRLMGESVKVDGSAGTNSTIGVMTNTSCTVESSASWLSGEVSTGGRFSRLNVKVSENNTGTERSAVLSVLVKGLPSQKVTVIQAAKK